MQSNNDTFKSLVIGYLKEYRDLRDKNQSLSDYDFYDQFGLHIKCPWDAIDAVALSIVEHNNHSDDSIVVVYPEVDTYSQIRAKIEKTKCCTQEIMFINWHEIFWAIHSVQKDTRPMQEMRNTFKNAALLFVLQASKVDINVIDAIKSHSSGCVIFLN